MIKICGFNGEGGGLTLGTEMKKALTEFSVSA